MRLRYAFLPLLVAGLLFPSAAASQSVSSTDAPPPAAGDSLDEPAPVSQGEAREATGGEGSAPAEQDAPELSVDINGSLRFNALFRSYGTPFETPPESGNDAVLGDGGFTFDTFRIGASGSYGDLIFDTEYAIYPESFGGLFIHHGWVGYNFAEDRQVQVGVSQVPFGLQPYASSSWFFNIPYYVGLEDDYDAGVKAIYTPGNWELKGAYYMNAEQLDFFAGQNFSRYSYDVAPNSTANYLVVPGDRQDDEDGELGTLRPDLIEEHQFNGKVSYTFDHGEMGSSKVGASGQVGQLLNLSSEDADWSSAFAVHARLRYAGFDAKLEFAQQNFSPPLTDSQKEDFDEASDVDYGAEDFVVMGAYAFPQRVASDHRLYSSSLAYHIPVDFGPISEFKPYYDFSLLNKYEVDDWNDNVTHDVGVLTSAGPLFVYTDLNVSKGHPFNHPADNFASVTAENADDEWRVAFNMNIGIYF